MDGRGTIRFEQAFDWDADGTVEVVVRVDDHYYEDTSTRRVVLAYTGGSVVPYAPAAGIALERVVDDDGDGRPDLVGSWRGWHGAEECGEDPPVVATPAVLFHSLTGGTFASDDAAASAFLRRACPSAPTQLLGPEWPCGEQDARVRIACARAWGVSADDARRRVAAERDGLPAAARELSEWDALDTFATIDPPLTLR
jgi:hypothetical protein